MGNGSGFSGVAGGGAIQAEEELWSSVGEEGRSCLHVSFSSLITSSRDAASAAEVPNLWVATPRWVRKPFLSGSPEGHKN